MNNESKSNSLEIKIPESLNNAVENLSSPVTKTAGQSLADIWDLVFGGLGELAEKRRLLHAHHIEQFKEELNKKIQVIPEEKLTFPDLQIVAGSLSDAQYCIDKADLRTMFENLIASSMNADKSENVHPSFSSIIRRMSPYDAQLLNYLKSEERHPIVNFEYQLAQGYSPLLRNVLFPTSTFDAATRDSRSLECLQSLGLIVIHYGIHLTQPSIYDPFYTHIQYTAAKKLVDENPSMHPDLQDIHIEKGILDITDLGKLFISVCC